MQSLIKAWRDRYSRGKSYRDPSARRTKSPAHRGLRLEPLEERQLLTAIPVDSLADGPVNHIDGNTTLRDALDLAADANHPGADEITFSASLGLDTTPGEIELTEGQLVIDSDVAINGPDASALTISGANSCRIFDIHSGTTVALSGLTLRDGRHTSAGGAIASGADELTIEACHILDSTATVHGGGIYSVYGDLIVRDSVISGNVSETQFGGGIYIYDGTLDMSGTTVESNEAGYAGGVFVLDTDAIISDSLIDNNTAIDGGGIEFHNDGGGTLTNVTISGNTSSRYGGGVYHVGRPTRASQLINCTISNNSAGYKGGGIYLAAHDVRLDNTIVADNTATTADPDLHGSFNGFSSYNLIGDTAGSTGFVSGNGNLLNVDANLGPLAENGGPTMTHDLWHGCPAIDAGSVTPMPGTSPTTMAVAWALHGSREPLSTSGRWRSGSY